ncbi:phosphate/phosphite/phosphonate ABC transporter substrate-binding protein [Cohnella cholangitidis]|uniref:Phosphate/phosphite/phosphonate ABC transporter substrate-binding protein n=1 Tax=Cohnella cholangitidis TaxID=2598458 RepID=A0A7G5BW23_9BACL|nr:phosphate/phosphite/phosphonate ABC transporter substrate-binding protein [Cohnella cholangitidis]QMV41157.1 phosphate/phosphite/phosphonate ABC transporter substrate-binding protein [Cohnella cholangitidis]
MLNRLPKMRFMLVISIVLLILAGCGNKNDNSGSNAEPSASNSESAATESASPSQEASPSPEETGYVPTELTVQFVPSQNAETLEAKAKPLEKLLSDALGIPVKVSVSTDYNTIIEAMQSKKVDVGFLPPNTYVQAKEMGAAEVILQAQRFGVNDADGQPTTELADSYKSMIIVKADSDIQTLADLKGKKIAWQSATSSAGFVYPAVELKKAGVDPNTDVTGIELKGHDKGVLAVLNGDADAAAIFQDARNIVLKDVPDVFEKTRVLHFTTPIPNDTISVRSDMNKEWMTKIQDAFIGLGTNEESRKIIFEIYSHQGYAKSTDSNFDSVREYSKALQ